MFIYEWDCVKNPLHGHSGPHRETYEFRHRRQVNLDEAERLESHSRQNEDRSSRFDQNLKGQGERRGRSISRARSSVARSNSRSRSSRSSSASLIAPSHSHKRRRRSPLKGRKDGKSGKHRRSPSREKGRERNEGKRSVLTGKKVKLDISSLHLTTCPMQIKLRVKKERGDDEREANRQELLEFLNSAYE